MNTNEKEANTGLNDVTRNSINFGGNGEKTLLNNFSSSLMMVNMSMSKKNEESFDLVKLYKDTLLESSKASKK